jgi:hypothetical protein
MTKMSKKRTKASPAANANGTSSVVRGNSAKDSKYLALITNAIEGKKDHPRHRGIQMQAHHVISGEGMRLSGLGSKIEEKGYDINLLPNLAFIPCTLQGACHMGIQPHRGNHTSKSKRTRNSDDDVDQDDYIDDHEPESYHHMVKNELQELAFIIDKACKGDDAEQSRKVIKALNDLSEDILEMIQLKPHEAQLTALHSHFGKTGVGCSGLDSVTTHKERKKKAFCPVGRNHLFDEKNPSKSQAKGQKIEKIRFPYNQQYRLKFEI